MKKLLSILMVLIIFLSACSSEEEDKTLVFWSAPNLTQFDYWTALAEDYNANSGSEYTIEVQQMPESPSSEAGIQNAIATGETPIASENITRGFATELYESDAIINLDELSGFSDLVSERNMNDTISSWAIDGSNYVFPLYSVPALLGWNTDLLTEYGVNEVPTSYDDVLSAADNFSGSDTYLLNGTGYMIPENWWVQWTYTFSYYYAESDGQGFYENGELIADDEAMISFLEFLDELGDTENGLFLQDAIDPFENDIVASAFISGWQITQWKDTYPDKIYNENFVTSLPINSDGDSEYTFADSKGVSFYTGYEQEQYDEMINFLTYAFSDNGDLEWMETTGLTSARDDLLENEVFDDFFTTNPAMVPYAEAIPNSIPSMSSADMVEIQTQMGKNIQTMLTSDQSAEETWEQIKVDIEGITNE